MMLAYRKVLRKLRFQMIADTLPTSGAGIWRCLALEKLSHVEVLDAPWRTEPHAPQRCVEHIELDADNYPGGDPQNGQ